MLTKLVEHADLFVAFCAVALAAWTGWLQRKHMRLSVRPVAEIQPRDFEDEIGVCILNKGLGPMQIAEFVATAKDGKTYCDLISHMPQLPNGIFWSTFFQELGHMVIENGQQIPLIRLRGNPESKEFSEARDLVRSVLSSLTIHLKYEDLYGSWMPAITKELAWFGRK